MKRALHQAIVFFSLLLIVTIIRLPYGSYRESALPYLRTLASPKGVTLDFADLNLRPPFRVSLDKLNMLLPVDRFPVPVNIESATFNANLFSLLTLGASGAGTVKLYQGTLVYDVDHSLFGNSTSYSASLNDLSLAAHPILGSFGFTGTLEGKFSGKFKRDTVTGRAIPESGEYSLALRNGAFIGGVKLFQLVRIPEVKNLSLVANAKLESGLLTISALNLDSSLGSANGKGQFRVKDNGNLGDGKLNAKIHLTDTGKQNFGGYLALAAQAPIENPSADWKVDAVFDQNGRGTTKVSLP